MSTCYPVYRYRAWHPSYIYHASTAERAFAFACAFNSAAIARNGCYLAPSHEAPADCKLDNYKGWNITFEYGYYNAISDDYDASWEGEETGWVDNGLKLSERSLAELLMEIELASVEPFEEQVG